MHVSKPALFALTIPAIVGFIVIYETAKPYALNLMYQSGWPQPTYTPDSKAAEYSVTESGWHWCFDQPPERRAKKQ